MEIFKKKMSANIQYELTETGYIKANNMLEELIKDEKITKKIDNVILRLDNLLINGKEINKGYYDMLTNEIILELKGE